MGTAQNATLYNLSPKQLKVIEGALELGYRRNIGAICAEASVARSTFYRWLKDDEAFKAVWQSLWQEIISRHLPGALVAMAHKAQGGDVGAGRLIAELAGIVKQQIQQSGVIQIEYVNDWRSFGANENQIAKSA